MIARRFDRRRRGLGCGCAVAGRRLFRDGLERFCGLRQIADEHALHDARAMLVDDAHVRAGSDANFAQKGDRVFAREVELFGELVNPYHCQGLVFSFIFTTNRISAFRSGQRRSRHFG